MLVSISIRYLTQDCADAGTQAVAVFDKNLAVAAADIPPTAAVSAVHFGLQLFNPLARRSEDAEGGFEYSLKDRACYLVGALDYADYIEPSWPARIEGVHHAAVTAIEPPSRYLPDQQKSALLTALGRARDASLADPPPVLTKLTPVWLIFEDDNQPTGVALERPAHLSFGPWRFVEVPPSEVPAVRVRYFSTPPAPTTFRLYRDEGDALLYREAWIEQSLVIEHWGTAGDQGETRRHPITAGKDGQAIMAELKAKAQGEGFQPIPIARHRCIVARCKIPENGSVADLDRRHALEQAIDQALGWTGLGFCDGGDIGGGEMAVFSYVADLNLGLEIIAQVLEAPDFRRFRTEVAR